ncbi:MAG: Gfo/Idh/MocA family protein [Terriglobia bacterium]
MSNVINRRDFILRTGLATAGAGLALSSAPKSVLGANDRIMVGVIGTGRQGSYDMKDFAEQPDVRIAAVCDVYQPNLDGAGHEWVNATINSPVHRNDPKPQVYHDFRQILDRKDIDVVVIGTPDNWHALNMIMACDAGKDVYVEKPISVVVDEGKAMVDAARKHKRVVQVGTQQRSGIHFQKAVQLVQDGFMGKVSFVRTWNYGNEYPEGIGNPPDSDPPATLDWNMWLGPAPKVPFNANRFGVAQGRWSTFRYFWDYAGGMMTDWGVHLMDIVQWAMKVEGPKAVTASGGKWYLQDNRQTPDTLQVTYEYPGFVCVYENRTCNGNSMYAKGYGMEFHGTDGTLFLDREGFEVYPEKQQHGLNQIEETAAMKMASVNNAHFDHVRNFLDCVKSRQRPISDIEIGHRSTSVCLLGNIAYRAQERIVWDVNNQKLLQGGAKAAQLLGREYRAPWKLKS